MTDQVAILEAFALLRKQCDPRGHALLKALEDVCLTESAALERVMDAIANPAPVSNVVSMIDRYSVKA